jgi:hypothetical protein
MQFNKIICIFLLEVIKLAVAVASFVIKLAMAGQTRLAYVKLSIVLNILSKNNGFRLYLKKIVEKLFRLFSSNIGLPNNRSDMIFEHLDFIFFQN